ncbi:MAG: hypothetical protein LC122_13800 [Chitinophagales bacterium]|nr:hypothetical protein [Chitinophagales bacterium]
MNLKKIIGNAISKFGQVIFEFGVVIIMAPGIIVLVILEELFGDIGSGGIGLAIFSGGLLTFPVSIPCISMGYGITQFGDFISGEETLFGVW